MRAIEAVKHLKTTLPNAVVNESEFLGEITLEVRKEALKEVLALLKQSSETGFEVLMDLTGVDYIHPDKKTKVVYWLHHPSQFERMRVIVYARRDESIPSVVDLWEGANWYERELYDFFGVIFDGHPNLTRILMPDDWEGHPLRRDYALTEEKVQFKHNREPKIPSEIINIRRTEKLLPP